MDSKRHRLRVLPLSVVVLNASLSVRDVFVTVFKYNKL